MNINTSTDENTQPIEKHEENFPCVPGYKETPSTNKGKKYKVCIEGNKRDWDKPVITTEEIAILGGWDPSAGVLEIDNDNNERQLQPNEVVELKPGHGFSKKICWQRGLTCEEERIQAEIDYLKQSFPDLQYIEKGRWVLIPNQQLSDGWSPSIDDVAFQIPQNGYPGNAPYGIYVRAGITFNGQLPNNYNSNVSPQPPFEGDWGILSWTAVGGHWKPGATVASGANLVNWVNSFSVRFKGGR